MNSTQKRTGTLKTHKFANTDSKLYQNRSKTASTSKAMGLTDEMMAQIEKDEDLHCLLKLHHTVQKVKNTNNENSVKIKELKELFTDLTEKIQAVFKEQSNTSGASLADKKKDDMKKTK
ncbi:UNKNOWN [Stylonychia lemnae]|uniref:Uncharacterized protein n=1 Tax=Stylonychia lemnae TaxID=5949 RepID=A0A077ZU45_STYLE|nr:UNKNOWN [Stylonychia lemnae]|eukprot:CDW73397.1 UNKNOWN [Stylonychia lemnae]